MKHQPANTNYEWKLTESASRTLRIHRALWRLLAWVSEQLQHNVIESYQE